MGLCQIEALIKKKVALVEKENAAEEVKKM